MENDNKKMSTTHKALIGLGALSGVAGLAGLGKQISNVMVKKKQLGLFASEAKKAVDEFGPKLQKLSDKMDYAEKNPGLFGIRKGYSDIRYGIPALLNKNKMEGKFYKAALLAKDKEQEFRNAIPKSVTNLDRNLLLAGSGGIATGLYFGTKTAELVATKESVSIPKPIVRPNLLSLPTNYSKMTQSGEIIENADKMDKIAEAVNSIFPREPKSKDRIIKKQSLEIDKRDEALAVREQELMEKHENLKQIQKAVKDTNKKLEFYKQKAVENYSQSLEHESNAN
jgi:hypothetical protein